MFATIALITTVLRLWVRKARRVLGWDDFSITIAMVCTVIYAVLTFIAVSRGKGKRSIHLSKENREFVNMYSWGAQFVLFTGMALVKISVCLLVLRIKSSRYLLFVTRTVIALLVAITLEVIIVLLAQCKPFSAHWRPGTGTCWPTEVRIYSIYVQAGKTVLP